MPSPVSQGDELFRVIASTTASQTSRTLVGPLIASPCQSNSGEYSSWLTYASMTRDTQSLHRDDVTMSQVHGTTGLLDLRNRLLVATWNEFVPWSTASTRAAQLSLIYRHMKGIEKSSSHLMPSIMQFMYGPVSGAAPRF